MGWGALLKAAVSLGGRAIKAVAKSVGGAVVHPQQTLKGLGSATKSAKRHKRLEIRFRISVKV